MTYKEIGRDWTEGTVDGFTFHIKHFEKGSEYGINNGRISKLWIAKDGKTLANYDRGWDVKAAPEAREAFKQILSKFN